MISYNYLQLSWKSEKLNLDRSAIGSRLACETDLEEKVIAELQAHSYQYFPEKLSSRSYQCIKSRDSRKDFSIFPVASQPSFS